MDVATVGQTIVYGLKTSCLALTTQTQEWNAYMVNGVISVREKKNNMYADSYCLCQAFKMIISCWKKSYSTNTVMVSVVVFIISFYNLYDQISFLLLLTTTVTVE